MNQGGATGLWIQACAPLQRLGLAGLAGACAALGQAPFDLWFVALPAFAALILLIGLADTPRKAGLAAWVGGTAHFAVALHWIVEPFFVDAARHGWMAPFALTFMAAGLALFWFVSAWVSAWLVPARGGVGRIVLATTLLILAEAARATVLTGFPWAHPGHILIDTPMLAVAQLVGPHGLNALVMGYAAAAALLALRFGRRGLLLSFLPILGVPLITLARPAPEPALDAPIVRLIQPNAPQHLKWRPDMVPLFFQRGLDLTAAVPTGPQPDLIVWPETSLPVVLGRSDAARTRITEAAGAAQILIGAQRYNGLRPRNAVAQLDADGQIVDVYDKHHLVPFGEYLPIGALARRLGLRGLAETLSGGYQPGPGPAVFDLGADLGHAFPMICYEAIFPGYIRAIDRPDWMVHLTNDAWFGEFSGPYQHLALARLRAAELGLPVLRAANTGISAVIDARGQIIAALPLGEVGFLDVALPPPLPPTVYAATGDLPVLLLVFLATTGALAAVRRRAPLHPEP